MHESEIIQKIESTLGNTDELIIAKAPGRINLIGEHTDYNLGLVLPAAIKKYCYFGLKPNKTSIINVHAVDLNEKCSLDTNSLASQKYLWANFLVGILLEYQKRNINLSGFDCVITSQVPIGAGLSSSSALECSILVALNKFYESNFDNWTLINMSQSSNHNFLGIKGGILDQFSSLFGKEEKVMLMDCNDRSFEYINLPKSDYTWFLVNSCVKHNHLTSAYNDRVNECKAALKTIQKSNPNISHLSEINSIEQIANSYFDSKAIKDRALYIFKENARVKKFVRALRDNDMATCGEVLYDSHNGLSQEYEVSCEELDFLVELTKTDINVLGARMMGGGFGGCTLNLVHKDAIKVFTSKVKDKYSSKFNIAPEFYVAEIGPGAAILQEQ